MFRGYIARDFRVYHASGLGCTWSVYGRPRSFVHTRGKEWAIHLDVELKPQGFDATRKQVQQCEMNEGSNN
eukprot:3150785-Pyramimonas_sp.AAC.2